MKCKIIFNTRTVPTFEDFEKSNNEYEACSINMLIEYACKEPINEGYLLTSIGHSLYRFEYNKSTKFIFTEAIGELKPKVPLTFETLRKANIQRLPEFKNSKGEPAHSKSDGSDWSPAQWLQAVIGELGEYANVMKKVERGDLSTEEAKPLIEKELADVMTYLDILAFRVDVDLSKAVQEKFNEVSERVGCSLRIENNEVVRKEAKPKVKTYGELEDERNKRFKLPVTVTNKELQDALDEFAGLLKKDSQEEEWIESLSKSLATDWILNRKISNTTRAKIETLIKENFSEIIKTIKSKKGTVTGNELIETSIIIGDKFGKVARLKAEQIIEDDLKELGKKEAGCGTSIFQNYDYNPKNGELTPKKEFVAKLQNTSEAFKSMEENCEKVKKPLTKSLDLIKEMCRQQTEQEFWNNHYKLSKHELFVKKSFSSDIGGALNEMIHWKLFRNYAEIYPLNIPRRAIDSVFSFEFQGIDNGKQYLFYHVKQVFHARQNSSLQIRAIILSCLFDYFSKQLGTKIVGMLINGSKENTKLNPGDLIQFYDDRNVLYNFRLVKSSDKNVEVSLS